MTETTKTESRRSAVERALAPVAPGPGLARRDDVPAVELPLPGGPALHAE